MRKPYKPKLNSRYTPEYWRWRAKVLKRDKHRCQFPGCTTPKTKLQVHHIIRYADTSYLRWSEKNGLTLCRTHHDSIKGKEHHYVILFTMIVQKNESK